MRARNRRPRHAAAGRRSPAGTSSRTPSLALLEPAYRSLQPRPRILRHMLRLLVVAWLLQQPAPAPTTPAAPAPPPGTASRAPAEAPAQPAPPATDIYELSFD